MKLDIEMVARDKIAASVAMVASSEFAGNFNDEVGEEVLPGLSLQQAIEEK